MKSVRLISLIIIMLVCGTLSYLTFALFQQKQEEHHRKVMMMELQLIAYELQRKYRIPQSRGGIRSFENIKLESLRIPRTDTNYEIVVRSDSSITVTATIGTQKIVAQITPNDIAWIEQKAK